jgi:hypothetical protein
MNIKTLFGSMAFGLIFIAVVLPAVFLVPGCATRNPAYTALTPQQQATNTSIPQYIPDPRINSYSNSASQLSAATAPVNPYAGITDWGIKIGFGLAGLIGGAVAQAKNKNGVIDTMAAGVLKAGPAASQAVLDHAGNTDHFSAVASALNDNTGVNQTATGASKT